MNTAWSHLPNAAHIDKILQTLRSHTSDWSMSWNMVGDMDGNGAWNMTLYMDSNRKAAWDMAENMSWDMARAWHGARHAGFIAARNSILALIIWDDSSKYLDMLSDELRVWAELSGNPAAVLLLPAVIAFERIEQKSTELIG